MTYYAVIDCDNCFVSCERVFRPDLRGRPVVVLSNNDGCVVARSNEAKQLGIPMGLPYYQLLQRFPKDAVTAFSGNYELYGELTARVMSIIRREAPLFYRYSIDEAFVILDTDDAAWLKHWGEQLHRTILRHVGMPVSIGIAVDKTLAKIASHYAKRYPGYRHCCLIANDEQRQKAIHLLPIGDVWGIGRRMSAQLVKLGIDTADAFARQSEAWVHDRFSIVAVRTWRELNGIDAIPMETPARRKSICVSRSFADMTSNLETLKSHVSNFAADCAEKLRHEGSAATEVAVFIGTNRFRDDLSQYCNLHRQRLDTPTNSMLDIVKVALDAVERIYRPGLLYKRAGVTVATTDAALGIQTDLLSFDAERYHKMQRLDKIIDLTNRISGPNSVSLATQQYPQRQPDGRQRTFSQATRHDHRSRCFTTRWTDIIELH